MRETHGASFCPHILSRPFWEFWIYRALDCGAEVPPKVRHKPKIVWVFFENRAINIPDFIEPAKPLLCFDCRYCAGSAARHPYDNHSALIFHAGQLLPSLSSILARDIWAQIILSGAGAEHAAIMPAEHRVARLFSQNRHVPHRRSVMVYPPFHPTSFVPST
jgi:hypothetical protein